MAMLRLASIHWRVGRALCSAVLFAAGLAACDSADEVSEDEGNYNQVNHALAASANPPGGLTASQVPQFVSISFDDNYDANGMNWTKDVLFNGKVNPAGSGNAATFDGTAARTTYYHN